MSGVFMRGDAFKVKDNKGFYMVGYDDGNYYYLIKGDPAKNEPNMMFVSLSYDKIANRQITLTINSQTKNNYSFKGTYGTNLVGNVSVSYDVMLLSVDFPPGIEFFLTAVGTMGGNGDNLYPGIWYKFLYNGNYMMWPINNCTTLTKPFCSNTNSTFT